MFLGHRFYSYKMGGGSHRYPLTLASRVPCESVLLSQAPHLPPTASCIQHLPPSPVPRGPRLIPLCLQPPQILSLKRSHVPTQGILILSSQGLPYRPHCLHPLYPSSQSLVLLLLPEGSGSTWPCPRLACVPPALPRPPHPLISTPLLFCPTSISRLSICPRILQSTNP